MSGSRAKGEIWTPCFCVKNAPVASRGGIIFGVLILIVEIEQINIGSLLVTINEKLPYYKGNEFTTCISDSVKSEIMMQNTPEIHIFGVFLIITFLFCIAVKKSK